MTAKAVKLVEQAPSENELAEQANSFLEVANSLTVDSHGTLQTASVYLSDNKREQTKMEDQRTKLVKPLNDHVKDINAMFKPFMEILKNAEHIVKQRIGKYHHDEQERIRKDQAAAEAAARKERDRLEARAASAAAKGQVEKAQNLELQAATTVAVMPAVSETKVTGVSVRMVWKGQVTDVKAFCLAIANGDIPASVVEFKASELNRVAAFIQNNKTIPGFKVYQDSSVASR